MKIWKNNIFVYVNTLTKSDFYWILLLKKYSFRMTLLFYDENNNMNLLWSKTLETERLLIHKTEEKDLKRLWEILCFDNVSKYYLTTKINYNWEDEKKWQYKKLEEAGNPDIFRWTIELKNSNIAIWQIDITENSDFNDIEIRDIWRFIDPKYQGKWYAYEAAFEVFEYMFLEVWIKSIRTSAAIDNPSSRKLMEKLWFKRLNGTKFTKYTLLANEIEAYKYELTKEDIIWAMNNNEK